MTTYLLERAPLPDSVHEDLAVTVEDGRCAEVRDQFTRFDPQALADNLGIHRSAGESVRAPGTGADGLTAIWKVWAT